MSENNNKVGWPGAIAAVAFFAMVSVSVYSCTLSESQPDYPVLNCPDGYAPKYYHWSKSTRAECVKAE